MQEFVQVLAGPGFVSVLFLMNPNFPQFCDNLVTKQIVLIQSFALLWTCMIDMMRRCRRFHLSVSVDRSVIDTSWNVVVLMFNRADDL